MTVLDLSKRLDLTILSGLEAASGRTVGGCYIGDLLSWVMGRCKKDDVWITVQTNLNVLAVAFLADCACVLLPEGIEAPHPFLERAAAENIIVLSSPETAFSLALKIGAVL